MNTIKQYSVRCFAEGDFVNLPGVAVFEIDIEFARTILELSTLVAANDIDKVVKCCHHAQFLQFDPANSPDDAEDVSEENDVRTECDVLVVEKEEFFFSACLKHTDINIRTERQSIADLVVYFGLVKPLPGPAQIVIATEGGCVLGVTSNVPVAFLVYDYDVRHCAPHNKISRPALDGGQVETLNSKWTPAYLDPEKIAEIVTVVKPPELGRIWWTAANAEEATNWRTKYLRRGASNVELKPRYGESPYVDVIITLDRSRSNEILEYPVTADEFLVE